MNKWFEGRVIFEIDTYFTRDVIRDPATFNIGLNSANRIDYWIQGNNIEEIKDIIEEYECTLVTHDLNDDDALLHSPSTAGIAGQKHGTVFMYALVRKNFPNQYYIEEVSSYNGNGIGNGFQTARNMLGTFIIVTP